MERDAVLVVGRRFHGGRPDNKNSATSIASWPSTNFGELVCDTADPFPAPRSPVGPTFSKRSASRCGRIHQRLAPKISEGWPSAVVEQVDMAMERTHDSLANHLPTSNATGTAWKI
jgi:hypothetical protein